MTDTSIGSFLAARRKAIAGGIVPHQAALAVQGIIAFLGIYGVHEVANSPLALAPSASASASMGPDVREGP